MRVEILFFSSFSDPISIAGQEGRKTKREQHVENTNGTGRRIYPDRRSDTAATPSPFSFCFFLFLFLLFLSLSLSVLRFHLPSFTTCNNNSNNNNNNNNTSYNNTSNGHGNHGNNIRFINRSAMRSPSVGAPSFISNGSKRKQVKEKTRRIPTKNKIETRRSKDFPPLPGFFFSFLLLLLLRRWQTTLSADPAG